MRLRVAGRGWERTYKCLAKRHVCCKQDKRELSGSPPHHMTEGQGWLLGTEMEDCYMQAGTTQFAGAPEGPCSVGDTERPACVCAFWPEKKAIDCTSCLYNYRITLSADF